MLICNIPIQCSFVPIVVAIPYCITYHFPVYADFSHYPFILNHVAKSKSLPVFTSLLHKIYFISFYLSASRCPFINVCTVIVLRSQRNVKKSYPQKCKKESAYKNTLFILCHIVRCNSCLII